MNKAKKLFWISGIIGLVFITMLIVLAASDKINIGGMIAWSVILLLIILVTNLAFYYHKKRKDGVDDITAPEKSAEVMIDKIAAQELTKNILAQPVYAEMIYEVPYEDIPELGSKNTPVYVTIVRGEFERKLFGIVINMINPKRQSIEEYDDTKMSYSDIKKSTLKRANGVAFSPTPEIPMRRRRMFNPMTGVESQEEEPIINFNKVKDEGGLS